MEFQNMYIQLFGFSFFIVIIVRMLLLGLCVSARQPVMPRATLWGHLSPAWVLVPWTPRACGQAAPGQGHVASDHKSGAALAQALQLPAPPGFAALLVFSEQQQNSVHSDSKGGIGLDVLGTSQPSPTLYVNV
ncbi:polycomb group ring finger 3 [Homo sapiens]|uniref:Polycomb group ring finger 3 n=1 Tax=Homo sapiens TaxID=9606 RepID=A0A087WVH5_HUMAN|nr:polycomb group ring finger 3 [Homo sapiens]